jgi:hypothetical protein
MSFRNWEPLFGHNLLLQFSCALAETESTIRVDDDIVVGWAFPTIPAGVAESCGLNIKLMIFIVQFSLIFFKNEENDFF